MPGTKSGGQKARDKNLARDPDFYRNIGRKGGQNGKTGGFRWMLDNGQEDKVRAAGRKGGLKSRRRKATQ